MGLGEKFRTQKTRENRRLDTLASIYTAKRIGSLTVPELPEPPMQPKEQEEWNDLRIIIQRIVNEPAAQIHAVTLPEQTPPPIIETIPAAATA